MSIQSVFLSVGVVLVAGSLLYVFLSRFNPAGGLGERTPTNIYAVTAGAMSLLIAFTMSLTFGQYLTAQQSSQQEAAAVMMMSRAATFMPAEIRDPLRDQLVCYAQQVISIEWAAMQDGKTDTSPEIKNTLSTIDGILAANSSKTGEAFGMWEGAMPRE